MPQAVYLWESREARAWSGLHAMEMEGIATLGKSFQCALKLACGTGPDRMRELTSDSPI